MSDLLQALTFISLSKFSRRHVDDIFLFFSIGYGVSGDNLHEISNPAFWKKETICMKYQVLFSRKQ